LRRQGRLPLKTQYIDRGLVLFEYRNLVRDPVDMTAALLARCGGERHSPATIRQFSPISPP
jgi:hypothetical protein